MGFKKTSDLELIGSPVTIKEDKKRRESKEKKKTEKAK